MSVVVRLGSSFVGVTTPPSSTPVAEDGDQRADVGDGAVLGGRSVVVGVVAARLGAVSSVDVLARAGRCPRAGLSSWPVR